MEQAFTQFLREGEASGHAVQIYRDTPELAEAVSFYLTAGFEAGYPGLVVATPQHWSAFVTALGERGWDAAEAQQRGLLTFLDAEETLAQFMEADGPSPSAFERVVGGQLDDICARYPGRHVRAFGEMVDVLALRGDLQSALALEELWREHAQTRPFSLLCGYGLDVFDRTAQVTALPDVCRSHSHVLPAWHTARLTLAVDRALEEVLGQGEAGKVYLRIGQDARRDEVPVAQLALMWVSAHMPVAASRILSVAQAYYDTPGLAAGEASAVAQPA